MIQPGQEPSFGTSQRGARVVSSANSFAEGGNPGWTMQDVGWSVEIGMDTPLMSMGTGGSYRTMATIRWVFDQTMTKYGDYETGWGSSGLFEMESPSAVMNFSPPDNFSADFYEMGSRAWEFSDYEMINDPEQRLSRYMVKGQVRTRQATIKAFVQKEQALPSLDSIQEIEDM